MSDRPGAAERVCLELAFWVPLAGCTYLALTPSPPQAVFQVSDVILHALAFSYLTFALGMARPRLSWAVLAAWMLGYGAFIEVAQSFEPQRSPELKDMLVDGAGIVVGLLALKLAGPACRRLLNRILHTALS